MRQRGISVEVGVAQAGGEEGRVMGMASRPEVRGREQERDRKGEDMPTESGMSNAIVVDEWVRRRV